MDFYNPEKTKRIIEIIKQKMDNFKPIEELTIDELNDYQIHAEHLYTMTIGTIKYCKNKKIKELNK